MQSKILERANNAIHYFDEQLRKFDTNEEKLFFIDIELRRNEVYPKQYEGDGVRWLSYENNLIDFKGYLIYKKYVLNKKEQLAPTDQLQLFSIFNDKYNGYEVCKGLFAYLEITINGVPNIRKGRAGKLMGAIFAMKKTPSMLIADFTDNQLLAIFNNYLNTKFKTFSKRSKLFDEAKDDSTRYIKLEFKK